MMSGTEHLTVERVGHVLVVTMNRPEAKNSLSSAMLAGMADAWVELNDDDDLRCAILTGAGGTFCSGMDLKARAAGDDAPNPYEDRWKADPDLHWKALLRHYRLRKPLIAAVEGVAVGGGLELCLACDLVVAARNARMGLPEVRHNVVAIGGGLFRLPRRIPYHIAMEVALSGKLHDPEFFARWGLVNRLVEPGQALDTAIEWAESMLVNGPTALAATKEIVFQGANWRDTDGWDAQMPIAQRALESEDRKEGLAAFAQKRKPVWKGR